MKTKKLNWRINHQIQSPKLRVIDSDDKQIGVISKEQALSKANEEGLDLIEIAPNAQPPVAKIMDLGKFRYEQEKKAQKEKRKTKKTDLKEVRFSPFIGDHDYRVRVERIREFLSDGDKVRLVVVFKGRQMGSKPFGYQLLEKVVDEFKEQISVDMEPKFIGRHLGMVISPTKKASPKDQKSKTIKKDNKTK